MAEETQERLIPEERRGELVLAEHLARYRFAAGLAEGRRVLDVACGEGYGTALLAGAGAASVVGADIDAATVAQARERYGHEFVEADVVELPFEDDSFDLVVSFETVEHVRDPERALDELRRVLAPGGLAVVSTPNADESLVENPFHIRELSRAEFEAMLSARFSGVRLMLQQNWLTSAVLGPEDMSEDGGERPLELDVVKVERREPDRSLYFVAICGDDDPPTAGQQAVLSGVYEAHRMAARLTDAEKTAERWHDEYTKAEQAAKRWHEEWEEAKRVAEGWHEAAGKWEAEAERRSATIAEMEASASWRLTRPLRAAKSRGRRADSG